MVMNENINDFRDREGHGTHVAGIIAAHGELPGVASGAELYIYRVFPEGKNASNFDIMKAIDRAKTDQCDLVNMSLGEAGLDEGIVSSIKDAYSEGLVCFAANGNDDRSPVSFPASYSLCIAVSAMGRKATFPAQTVQTGSVKAPFGKDKANFIADFSNIGPETDLTAPGVGIISTYPNDKYAVMDGTSMACPAATGMAARLLSGETAILAMPRNQARADAITKFLATKIKSLGFGANFEGKGMLFP
jgi:subtilisin